MGKWFVGKIEVDIEAINGKLPFKINPAKDGIFDFPIFHHSIIPCLRRKKSALKKTFNFSPALAG